MKQIVILNPKDIFSYLTKLKVQNCRERYGPIIYCSVAYHFCLCYGDMTSWLELFNSDIWKSFMSVRASSMLILTLINQYLFNRPVEFISNFQRFIWSKREFNMFKYCDGENLQLWPQITITLLVGSLVGQPCNHSHKKYDSLDTSVCLLLLLLQFFFPLVSDPEESKTFFYQRLQ